MLVSPTNAKTDIGVQMGTNGHDLIVYTICQHTYDLFTMCKEWEEPKVYGDGQFSQIESFVFRHPIIPERDIHFAFNRDNEMIDCYSVLPKR